MNDKELIFEFVNNPEVRKMIENKIGQFVGFNLNTSKIKFFGSKDTVECDRAEFIKALHRLMTI